MKGVSADGFGFKMCPGIMKAIAWRGTILVRVVNKFVLCCLGFPDVTRS